jgi:Nickel responsive protein SCO4226-like
MAARLEPNPAGHSAQYGSSAVVRPPRRIDAALVKQPMPEGHEEAQMDLYVIRRRNNWKTPDELEASAARSTAEGEKMSDEVRWIRSYVVEEEDGTLGTVCVYEGVSPEAISRHAKNAGMTADEITKVANTVIVREDPVPA